MIVGMAVGVELGGMGVDETVMGVILAAIVDVDVGVGVAVAGVTAVGLIVVGVTGVEVGVATEFPTLTLPLTQDDCIAIPFKSERSNPLGTAWVLRNATVEMPFALA